jgi:hypothetical protein
MRKTIATLAAVAAGVTAFGSLAGTAAADDPNARYTQGGYMGLGSLYQKCETPTKTGVLGQYGAWGYFIDGCTARVDCASSLARYCDTVNTEAKIETLTRRGDRVTMNARLRIFNSSGQVVWFRDQSCSGIDSCTINDLYPGYLSLGQSASVQCNGVRENRAGNYAKASCRVQLSRR